jgi:hypothetical protein
VFSIYIFSKASSNEDPSLRCISGFGAPMQFKMDDKWHLRGLYSSGFPSTDQKVKCADNHAISFTDVTKYTEFLEYHAGITKQVPDMNNIEGILF